MKPLPQMRQCHSPRVNTNDLSGRCCIGAFSAGAHQSFNGGNASCLQTLSDYNRVREMAMDELSFNPLYGRTHSNSTRHQNETLLADGRSSMLDCDVCRIIQIVSTLKHKRISIAGDSLQRQLFDGMECELFRRGFNMSEWTVERWPEDPPDQYHTGWKYGVSSKECFNVTLPDWMRSHHHNQSDHVEICSYGHYRPYPGLVQHQKIVNSSDIMLIDYGLHFLVSRSIISVFAPDKVLSFCDTRTQTRFRDCWQFVTHCLLFSRRNCKAALSTPKSGNRRSSLS